MTVPSERPPFWAPVEGGRLAVWDSGVGPAIVMLHGLSFDHSLFEPQVASLGRTWRLYRYDLRGHGRSAAPHPDRSHLDDLLELLDHLGLERVRLVGLSLGANVALAAAALHPERVERVALLSPGVPGVTWVGRPSDEARAVARSEGVEAAKRFWLAHPLFATTRTSPSAWAAVEAMVAAFQASQWDGGASPASLPEVAPLLEATHQPVLIMSGGRDLQGYRDLAGQLARRLPAACYVELAEVGHVLTLEEPAGVTAVLGDFLADRAGGPMPPHPASAGGRPAPPAAPAAVASPAAGSDRPPSERGERA